MATSTSRYSLHRATVEAPSFADEVRAGLSAVRKSIPPRFFYDDLGSALFDGICQLPEYYVTRAEAEILHTRKSEIAERIGPVNRVIELGSGSGRKTRILLQELLRNAQNLTYVPVDVDVSVLHRLGQELLPQFPTLQINAVAGDLRRPSRSLRGLPPARRSCLLFLGSTIGNLTGDEAVAMLRDARSVLSPGDLLLLGADLRKSKAVLEAAYNDPLGITAAFNLNLLQRINRELRGHFHLRSFAHRAFFEETESRIEMHLVSLRDQSVRIESLGMEVDFQEGETIHTENSYKYDDEMIASLTGRGGFSPVARWSDSNGMFADYLLTAV